MYNFNNMHITLLNINVLKVGFMYLQLASEVKTWLTSSSWFNIHPLYILFSRAKQNANKRLVVGIDLCLQEPILHNDPSEFNAAAS